ncbi:hypothetical protein CASFOL_035035 [Castilleja foliolosa]|uniref:F-box domain-containing protein n=1 Tax=Castilleja foliolosa TaxID=1961234 RepID=A0ABD3BRP5_9LAMI
MASEITSINHLPNDIVRSILSRLPVKTLLTLTSVSKSWNATISATISDPSFAQTHLQHQHYSNNSYNLFLRKLTILDQIRITYDFSLVRANDDDVDDDTRFTTQTRLGYPHPGWHNVLCTCDGVVLLTAYSRNSYRAFMLWNPTTQTKATFLFPYKFQARPAKHGLCHDPVTGDFKVVVACNKHYAVYSCKNNLWSESRDFPYSCEMGDSEGLFVDGVIYWVVYEEEGGFRSREIIYFDPRDDGFKKLEKPESMIHGNIRQDFDLVVLRGCLCLYGLATSDITAIRIWIKEKGKYGIVWTELMMIESLQRDLYFRPMCSLEDDKILLILDNDGLVVYNPREKTFGQALFGEPLDDSYIHVQMVPCMETLLFPLQNIKRPKRKRSKPLKYE